MKKSVLNVGQCGPDARAIDSMLKAHFAVEIRRVNLARETIAILKESAATGRLPDLVLINRKLDADYSDGIEILKAIKQDPEIAATPVMMVSNYPEFHDQAVAAGAEPGFGKKDLSSPKTKELLQKYLGSDRS